MSLRVIQVPGFFSTTGEPVGGGENALISDAWRPYDDLTIRTVIFATMYIGMGEITEKNIEEFADRIATMESLDGALRIIDGEPYYWTIDELRNYIGLRTNVTTVTKAAWNKVVLRMVADKVRRDLKARNAK